MSRKHSLGQKHEGTAHPENTSKSSTSEGKEETEKNNNFHECGDKERQKVKWYKSPEIWTAIGTVVLALFGIPSFLFLYFQLQESHHALKVDQRAWVGFGEIKSISLEQNKPFVIRVPLQNVGKTPANVKSAGFHIYVAKVTEVPDLDVLLEPKMATGVFILLPQQIQEMHASAHDRVTGVIPQDIWDKINSENFTILAFGKVKYTDVFNIEHWTRYCFRSVPGDFVEGIKFRPCPFYTGIDANEE